MSSCSRARLEGADDLSRLRRPDSFLIKKCFSWQNADPSPQAFYDSRTRTGRVAVEIAASQKKNQPAQAPAD
ncbi:hypothetical protein GCM10007937_32270 [Mesorhizobium albiziae]|nr:hypothetical protein GCM10007937_32270 [Mesorhizobium albiziae]